jgi:hypothetical protein
MKDLRLVENLPVIDLKNGYLLYYVFFVKILVISSDCFNSSKYFVMAYIPQ